MAVRELYSEKLAERQREASERLGRERAISIARVIAILAAIAIAAFYWQIALVPLAAFFVLVVWHERVIRARKHVEHSAAFYARGLARIDGTWAGKGDAGADFAEDHHPYASDFDLFGRGSLFELISLAVTRAGRIRLATWLKEQPPPNEILARQQAVAELRENVALREDIAIDAAEVAHDVEAAKIDEWAAMPAVEFSIAERVLARVLPAIGIVLLAITLRSFPELGKSWALIPTLVAFVAIGTYSRTLRTRVETITAGVERAEPALALLTGILTRLDRESFRAETLVQLAERVRGSNLAIDRLRRLLTLLDARRNQFFMPIGALLMWTSNLAFAIERWRTQYGKLAVETIEAVGTFEALSSLASFAFEHPDFATPELVAEGPLFDARELGHPLIPADRRITNDLRLGGELCLLIVSGSNMSGKSTMLRSAGIAAVLAQAGAPVCARSLRLSPMAVGASIRIHDSLQENASRFYAEILRIRQVLNMSHAGPLLFLLDEMLAGTNSHDRRIGAEAIVKALVDRGAIGLVSTHDLALAEIVTELAPRAANVHFEDHLEEGRVVFDYRMREGVVTKSNALALMRSVGIEV